MKKTALSLIILSLLTACSQQTPHGHPQKPASEATASAAKNANERVLQAHDIQGEKVVVKTARGEFPVPKNPQRIAVYDYGMVDNLTALGVPVGASIDKSLIDYLTPVIEKAVPVGTLFEPNYEALNAYQPQLIITGSRANKAIHQLNEIAPTIEMTADTKDMLNSTKERIDAFAQIFDKQIKAEQIKAELDQAFQQAKAAAQGKGNGLVILVNGGKMSAYGSTSRLGGWLHKDIGIEPADPNIKEGSHGQPISFEYIKQIDPDWLFVLDRASTLKTEGQAAKEVLNNPLVAQTNAWKNGKVVYLDGGIYLSAGGAQQLKIAAQQITDAFSQSK